MRISPVAFLRTNLMQNNNNFANKTSLTNPTFSAAPATGNTSWYKNAENWLIGKVFKFVPEQIKLKETAIKLVHWAGGLSTAYNRFIIGAFAFLTQPWIDLFNPDVDIETKKMSCLRTIAKIVIGTATGVSVRWLCINKLMPKLTKTGKELEKAENKERATLLMPTADRIAPEVLEKAQSLLKHHRNVIGTFMAIVVMMATDPPLTVFLTNFFNAQRKQLEQKKAAAALAAKGGSDE